jgi:hypothetical protein
VPASSIGSLEAVVVASGPWYGTKEVFLFLFIIIAVVAVPLLLSSSSSSSSRRHARDSDHRWPM